MVLAISNYRSDTGKEFSFLPASFVQLNSDIVASNLTFENLVPLLIRDRFVEINSPCPVSQFIPRGLMLHTTTEAHFYLNCPIPFNLSLALQLETNGLIRGFEFIGERVLYARLKYWL